MRVRIETSGNSAFICVPAHLMAAASLSVGQEVELREENGRLVIEPALEKMLSLDALLNSMRPETFHDEIDFGAPRGGET